MSLGLSRVTSYSCFQPSICGAAFGQEPNVRERYDLPRVTFYPQDGMVACTCW